MVFTHSWLYNDNIGMFPETRHCIESAVIRFRDHSNFQPSNIENPNNQTHSGSFMTKYVRNLPEK